MRSRRLCIVAGIAAAIQTKLAPAAPPAGLVELRPLPRPPADCVTPATRDWARQQIAAYEAEFGPLSRGTVRGTPEPIQFFPIAGNLYQDIFMGSFVDLDPSPGWIDFDCTDYTRDTHEGIDAGPRWFAEQRIGVPVFAAQDGVVIVAADGEDDENTAGSTTPGNLVFIDHGDGQVGYYYHLKKNSVAVAVNDTVQAGQQIAMAGSSGYSFGPHLHFGLTRDDVIYEPFAGDCRPGLSGWRTQPAIDRSHYFWDFGITHQDLSTVPWWPEPFPRDGQLAITDSFMEFWVLGAGLPADSTWRVKFRRPDDTIVFDSLEWPYGNSELYQWYLTWWHYPLDIIPDIQSTAGTWHVMLEMNGVLMIDAPLEMRPARTPDFNHAPEPISVSIDPPTPTAADILACRVSTSRTLDDVDYDVVQYRYVWRVNGAIIRDVTTAAQADMIPRGSAIACDEVTCDVTPGDGDAWGPTAQVGVNIAAACVGDLTDDGFVDLSDLSIVLIHFGQSAVACAEGDLDADHDVDLDDLSLLLVRFGTACP